MMASLSPPRAGQTTAILVVEDEPLQRMSLIEMVEEAGYVVIEATDADQAIAILEQRTDVRVILADIDMPGSMDGLRLAALIRDRWPPIEIVLTTAGLAPRMDSIPARAMFLPKPLNERRVRAALQQFATQS